MANKPNNYPPCPVCKTSRHVVMNGTPPDHLYVCCNCKGMFDDHPEEGGGWSDPTKAIEIAEERRIRERERARRR